MAKATDLDGPHADTDAPPRRSPATATAHDQRPAGERDQRPTGDRDRQPSSKRDRLLPWIAAERGIRALALLALGIVLLTHPDTNWAAEIKHLARSWGLDPSGNVVRKILDTVRKIPAKDNVIFGVIAIAYGALEGAESYGLARRRRWGEWLTLVATSILLAPEVWELARKVTPLKIAALVVNLIVVAYLYWRLRRRR